MPRFASCMRTAGLVFSKQEAAILNHALEQILLNARKSFAGIGMQPRLRHQ